MPDSIDAGWLSVVTARTRSKTFGSSAVELMSFDDITNSLYLFGSLRILRGAVLSTSLIDLVTFLSALQSLLHARFFLDLLIPITKQYKAL